MTQMTLSENPPITNPELNSLFESSWPSHEPRDFAPILERSLVYLVARKGERLIGFVNVAWDGGIHAFLLDPTVHRDFQRQGVGTALVRRAAEGARQRGAEWLHVDFVSELESFYHAAGFRPTAAGLLALRPEGAV